ncbi:MAG: sulfurtransferase [Sphingomonadales bacterium]|nr:sulfurtransferase [Sphingomonadales bacterium]MBD3774846.1 sulfurtransferase [Paracoccaceae bacterium]
MDSLVSTDWLAAELGSPDLVVIDASAHLPNAGRDPRAEFVAGHIPGARYLDLPSLKDTGSPVPNALPTAAQFSERMASLGIAPQTRVVVYDDSAVKTSARAWYMFRLFGHPQVAILDGGLGKWRAEGRALESGESACDGCGYAAPNEDRSGVRTKADMLANIDSNAAQVVDARNAERFVADTPDTVHGLPGGHIPGARNLFFADVFEADGTFKDETGLAEAFADAGVDLAGPVIASCGSGVTACVLLFAMHRLGHDHGELYDGSWSEWGADPATPKETGAAR